MKKIAVVALAMLLSIGVIAVWGCGGNGDETEDEITLYTGKYWSESNPSDYIEIMPNNTFTMFLDGDETSGSCYIEEGTLSLSAGSYDETMEISKGVITTSDGTKFAIVVEGEEEDSEAQKEAIVNYCREEGIDIPDLTVSDEKEVSRENPDWEIDYAFPAEAEGTGQNFLLHKVDEDWVVVAHTEKEQIGWTTSELEALGAPVDLATR